MPNPYETPKSQQPVTPSANEDSATVVSGQKLLIRGVLGYLCSVPILIAANMFLGGTPKQPVVTPLFTILLCLGLLCVLAALICASIAIFRMGKVLFPGSTRYLYAIGVLLPAPLVGLIVMVVANSNATGYLKSRGYKVGFFGAKR